MLSAIIRFCAILLFVSLVSPVEAMHRQQVLGMTTLPTIPPTVEGPGVFLPDSQFFFLDTVKQQLRLLISFSPEAKAKAHEKIAGERLAELRFMLAKNHESGVRIALDGISDNLKKAALRLEEAQMSGRNIEETARIVHIAIRSRQETLMLLHRESTGEMRKRVEATQEALMEAKIAVEDNLSQAELEDAIRDDISRAIDTRVTEADVSVREIEEELAQLRLQASASAAQALKRREETIKKAIIEKDETLRLEQERLLAYEKKKHDESWKVQEKVAVQARAAIESAKEAAKKYATIKEEIEKTEKNATGAATTKI